MMPIIATSSGYQHARTPSASTPPGRHPKRIDCVAQLYSEAFLHLSDGRCALADRLAHLALEHRCRALGVPA